MLTEGEIINYKDDNVTLQHIHISKKAIKTGPTLSKAVLPQKSQSSQRRTGWQTHVSICKISWIHKNT